MTTRKSQILSKAPLILKSNEPILSSDNLGWRDFNFNYFCCDSQEIPLHAVKTHCLGVSLRSQIKYERVDGRLGNSLKNSGSLTICPAKVDFWAALPDKFECIILTLKPQKLASFAPETINPNKVELIPTLGTAEPDHFVKGIALSLMEYIDENPPENNFYDNNFYVESLENALCAYLLRNYCTIEHQLKNYNGLPQYKLKLALDYINSNLSQKLRVSDIADLLGISKGYFSRLFRESMGLPPHHYILQQRLTKAQKLLKSSNLPLTDVAADCGYCSQSKMTYHFRSALGLTPKQYRELR